jgi:hypothetical protein
MKYNLVFAIKHHNVRGGEQQELVTRAHVFHYSYQCSVIGSHTQFISRKMIILDARLRFN